MATKSINWRTQLEQDVREASIKPPMTKSEAIAYYQEKFTGRGQAGWKQQLVHKLSEITGLKPKSLEKRFDSGSKGGKEPRINKPEPRNAAQYRALGAEIGYKPPKYGYHVKFDGWIAFSSVCERRSHEDINVVGAWATQVATEPSLMLNAMLLIYMEEDDQAREIEEQEPSVGFCEDGDTGEAGEPVHDPLIKITANERERHSGHGGQKRRFSFFDKR